MTVRLPADLAAQLEKLTQVTGRNKSAITVAALRNYVEAETWQIQDIEQGIAEAYSFGCIMRNTILVLYDAILAS